MSFTLVICHGTHIWAESEWCCLGRCLESMTPLFRMGTRTLASTRRHPRRLSPSLRIEGEGPAYCIDHLCAVTCDRCERICCFPAGRPSTSMHSGR